MVADGTQDTVWRGIEQCDQHHRAPLGRPLLHDAHRRGFIVARFAAQPEHCCLHAESRSIVGVSPLATLRTE